MTRVPFADVADLRAGIYGLLGTLFLPPTPERLESVVLEVGPLAEQARQGPGFPFDPALNLLLDRLDTAEAERANLANEYAHIFTPAGGGDVCLPYESRHVGDRQMQGSVAAEVEQAYAAGGLTLSATMAGELPDHVALELQFMCVLCVEEAASWTRSGPAAADAWLCQEQAFLERHLGNWLPRLAGCVLRTAPPESLYRHLADASHAFVVHDGDLVELILRAEDDATE